MLYAVGDKVVVRRAAPVDATIGGVALPNKISLYEGVVESAGDKCVRVAVGDAVLFGDYWANNVVREPDGDYVLLPEKEILAIKE